MLERVGPPPPPGPSLAPWALLVTEAAHPSPLARALRFFVAITLSVVPLLKMIAAALAQGGMQVRARFPPTTAVSAAPSSSIPLGGQPSAQVFTGRHPGPPGSLGPSEHLCEAHCNLGDSLHSVALRVPNQAYLRPHPARVS